MHPIIDKTIVCIRHKCTDLCICVVSPCLYLLRKDVHTMSLSNISSQSLNAKIIQGLKEKSGIGAVGVDTPVLEAIQNQAAKTSSDQPERPATAGKYREVFSSNEFAMIKAKLNHSIFTGQYDQAIEDTFSDLTKKKSGVTPGLDGIIVLHRCINSKLADLNAACGADSAFEKENNKSLQILEKEFKKLLKDFSNQPSKKQIDLITNPSHRLKILELGNKVQDMHATITNDKITNRMAENITAAVMEVSDYITDLDVNKPTNDYLDRLKSTTQQQDFASEVLAYSWAHLILNNLQVKSENPDADDLTDKINPKLSDDGGMGFDCESVRSIGYYGGAGQRNPLEFGSVGGSEGLGTDYGDLGSDYGGLGSDYGGVINYGNMDIKGQQVNLGGMGGLFNIFAPSTNNPEVIKQWAANANELIKDGLNRVKPYLESAFNSYYPVDWGTNALNNLEDQMNQLDTSGLDGLSSNGGRYGAYEADLERLKDILDQLTGIVTNGDPQHTDRANKLIMDVLKKIQNLLEGMPSFPDSNTNPELANLLKEMQKQSMELVNLIKGLMGKFENEALSFQSSLLLGLKSQLGNFLAELKKSLENDDDSDIDASWWPSPPPSERPPPPSPSSSRRGPTPPPKPSYSFFPVGGRPQIPLTEENSVPEDDGQHRTRAKRIAWLMEGNPASVADKIEENEVHLSNQWGKTITHLQERMLEVIRKPHLRSNTIQYAVRDAVDSREIEDVQAGYYLAPYEVILGRVDIDKPDPLDRFYTNQSETILDNYKFADNKYFLPYEVAHLRQLVSKDDQSIMSPSQSVDTDSVKVGFETLGFSNKRLKETLFKGNETGLDELKTIGDWEKEIKKLKALPSSDPSSDASKEEMLKLIETNLGFKKILIRYDKLIHGTNKAKDALNTYRSSAPDNSRVTEVSALFDWEEPNRQRAPLDTKMTKLQNFLLDLVEKE